MLATQVRWLTAFLQVKLLLDTLEKDQNPYQATVTCVRLRAQRPARDQVEDEADECLNQQLVSLEIDATERLRRAVSELEQMKLRMRAMVMMTMATNWITSTMAWRSFRYLMPNIGTVMGSRLSHCSLISGRSIWQ